MRLIDAEPILKFIEDGLNEKDPQKHIGYDGIRIMTEIQFAPTIDSPRPDWTPCAEGSMPEDDTNFCAWMQLEATIELNGRYSTRTVGRFYVPLVGIWVWADGWTSYPTETGITADKADIGKVVAWRYPSPYNPDRKEDAK